MAAQSQKGDLAKALPGRADLALALRIALLSFACWTPERPFWRSRLLLEELAATIGQVLATQRNLP
jgi:hypothetical protein